MIKCERGHFVTFHQLQNTGIPRQPCRTPSPSHWAPVVFRLCSGLFRTAYPRNSVPEYSEQTPFSVPSLLGGQPSVTCRYADCMRRGPRRPVRCCWSQVGLPLCVRQASTYPTYPRCILDVPLTLHGPSTNPRRTLDGPSTHPRRILDAPSTYPRRSTLDARCRHT